MIPAAGWMLFSHFVYRGSSGSTHLTLQHRLLLTSRKASFGKDLHPGRLVPLPPHLNSCKTSNTSTTGPPSTAILHCFELAMKNSQSQRSKQNRTRCAEQVVTWQYAVCTQAICRSGEQRGGVPPGRGVKPQPTLLLTAWILESQLSEVGYKTSRAGECSVKGEFKV